MSEYEEVKQRRFGVRFGELGELGNMMKGELLGRDTLAELLAALKRTYARASLAARRMRAGLLRPRRTEKINKEIYTALGIMRNLASADSGGRVTTDALVEQFAKTDGLLKPVYSGVLRLIRIGKKTEAIEYFSSAAGTELSRDFIMIIIEWDNIEPSRLQKTILSFRSAIKEIRTTELIKRDEVLSDLVYLPVIAGILIIFMNFIYIAYFIEQKELLTELFF